MATPNPVGTEYTEGAIRDADLPCQHPRNPPRFCKLGGTQNDVTYAPHGDRGWPRQDTRQTYVHGKVAELDLVLTTMLPASPLPHAQPVIPPHPAAPSQATMSLQSTIPSQAAVAPSQSATPPPTADTSHTAGPSQQSSSAQTPTPSGRTGS